MFHANNLRSRQKGHPDLAHGASLTPWSLLVPIQVKLLPCSWNSFLFTPRPRRSSRNAWGTKKQHDRSEGATNYVAPRPAIAKYGNWAASKTGIYSLKDLRPGNLKLRWGQGHAPCGSCREDPSCPFQGWLLQSSLCLPRHMALSPCISVCPLLFL